MKSLRSRRRLEQERGAAAVEFAIVAFLLFMLVFGIIDFGFAFFTWNTTANAAREGARKAAVADNVSEIVDRVYATSEGLDPDKMNVTVQCSPSGGTGYGPCGTLNEDDLIRVTVDYEYDYMTPLPNMVGLGSTLMVHASSESRYEGS